MGTFDRCCWTRSAWAARKATAPSDLATNEPITFVLQGDQIDLAPKLTEKTPDRDRVGPNRTRPAWLETRCPVSTMLILANEVVAGNVL